jgi:SNF2 family DNA or RNA helicase
LRPYQVEGFHFLAYLSANRFGGVLADDMGLGKTLQTLAWLLWLREQEQSSAHASRLTPHEPAASSAAAPADPSAVPAPLPSLVVCPKSVTDNWQAEALRFAPSLRVRIWSGEDLQGFSQALESADLHVLNYSQLRSLSERLAAVRWLAVVLDEGQYIKNPNSQTAQVARALRAGHRLVLTGTPIENRLLDLWSLMAFAMPGVLGSRAQFARLFDAKDDPYARRRLSARVRPFVLRRTKGQVATDLPERTEEDLFCEIEGEQKALYRAELKRAQQLLLGINTQKELAQQQFHLLTSLLRLRQICCHPRLVKPDSTVPGAKVEALLEQLEPLMEEGQKVLVFSQFVELLDLLKPLLEARQWPHFYLAGQTENRGALVKDFQQAEGPAVFLISLKAGGFGLNLTAASYVVLFDPWWNPAVEAQAIDRTHRIGQTNKVIAYRLLIKNSIEGKIRALQKQKKALAEDVLGEAKFSQSLTLEDLRFLFAD